MLLKLTSLEDERVYLSSEQIVAMSPLEMLTIARADNPKLRYALRVEHAADGGAVLGAFCTNAGGFIPVSVQSADGSWQRMPPGYLEIDGKAVGIEPDNWIE